MHIDIRVRSAEGRLFASHDVRPEETFLDLPRSRVRLRVLSVGSGATCCPASWRNPRRGGVGPVDQGHRRVPPAPRGAPGPWPVRACRVPTWDGPRPHARPDGRDLGGAGFGQAGLPRPLPRRVFALWYAAARPERVRALIAMGSPAVALRGASVRMPLSLLTVRAVGRVVLQSPIPRRVYRTPLALGLSPAAAATASDELVDVLRFAARRRGNARTVAALMHAIDGFRRPLADSVMTDAELRCIEAPTAFCWGVEDRFLTPSGVKPQIADLPTATLHEIRGGHSPWLDEPATCAQIVRAHLAELPIASAGVEPSRCRSTARPQETMKPGAGTQAPRTT